MNIAIIDIYPEKNARISKDTNGAFGTVNDYGESLIAKLWTRIMKGADWPPSYCAYSLAALRNAGHRVTFIRSRLKQFDFRVLESVDLCFVISSIVCHETELKLIRQIRKLPGSMSVGAIGPFATTVPSNYIEVGAFVISGEPEFFFTRNPDLDVLKFAEGIVTLEPENDLDMLAYPAWDIILEHVRPKHHLIGGGRTKQISLPILSTRGCPYSCRNYCTYPLQQGRSPRTRSVQNVIAEISHWQKRLGVSYYIFRDPVFSIRRRYTVELCEAILSSGIKIEFVIETHLKNLDRELILMLKKSGLRMVKVGIESSNTEILESVKRKSPEVDEQTRKIQFMEEQGIDVTCFYMFGFPDDTVESCRRTIDHAINLDTFGAQFSVFTPYPGTPIFADYRDKLIAKKYEEFTQWHLVFRHKNITEKEMRKILSLAYTKYFSRPTWIMGKLIRNRI